jgi:hypothetical protein
MQRAAPEGVLTFGFAGSVSVEGVAGETQTPVTLAINRSCSSLTAVRRLLISDMQMTLGMFKPLWGKLR